MEEYIWRLKSRGKSDSAAMRPRAYGGAEESEGKNPPAGKNEYTPVPRKEASVRRGA